MYIPNHEKIMAIYSSKGMRHRIFLKALNFLKEQKRVMNDAEVAKKCGKSPSIISQYISGEKQLPDEFIARFQSVYKVDFEDPATFIDLSAVDKALNSGITTMPARPYIQGEFFFRLMEQKFELVVEHLRAENEELFGAYLLLMSVYKSQELKWLTQVLTGTHYSNIGKDKKNPKNNH